MRVERVAKKLFVADWQSNGRHQPPVKSLRFSAFFQNCNCRQNFAFYEFQECTTAGRDVRHFVSDTKLVDSSQ
jgi:hypothetical protein